MVKNRLTHLTWKPFPKKQNMDKNHYLLLFVFKRDGNLCFSFHFLSLDKLYKLYLYEDTFSLSLPE